MENNEKINNSKELIAYLSELFPACFIATGEARPLKIGIFQDLAARLADDPRVSKTVLRSALRQYTSSWRYLHGLRPGMIRVDLDGNPAGELTEEHVTHAKTALKESKDKIFSSRRKGGNKPAKQKKPVVDLSTLKTGQQIQVMVGKSPITGNIKEITRDDVQVELATGMQVRVKAEHLVP
ncbi:RNA chaperone ProQ [uncultured Tolumonas sp.]|jgi:ProP effector|uniref:RNA chaperone ProQ n=1 Tax=uncultured Tolumonas sp. TaxID=263765 RepID=UPI0029303F07|nr:RNA chaperone ProQ [uncultured Tolumonas sp.]MDD2343386.1 RNA chaperone ProQ [Tolumonas sp.]